MSILILDQHKIFWLVEVRVIFIQVNLTLRDKQSNFYYPHPHHELETSAKDLSELSVTRNQLFSLWLVRRNSIYVRGHTTSCATNSFT
jgi:hypothetical protein